MKKIKLITITVFFFAVSITSCLSQNNRTGIERQKNLSDTALVDLVQKQTFKYFWNFAHPVSGMARERSNIAYDYGNEVVTTGGTGFGVMAIIVMIENYRTALLWNLFTSCPEVKTGMKNLGFTAPYL